MTTDVIQPILFYRVIMIIVVVNVHMVIPLLGVPDVTIRITHTALLSSVDSKYVTDNACETQCAVSNYRFLVVRFGLAMVFINGYTKPNHENS